MSRIDRMLRASTRSLIASVCCALAVAVVFGLAITRSPLHAACAFGAAVAAWTGGHMFARGENQLRVAKRLLEAADHSEAA